MLSSISGSLWNHTRRSSTKGNWNCCKSISDFTMNANNSNIDTSQRSPPPLPPIVANDQYASSSGESGAEDVVNEFKAVFKKYKKRRPLPDFSEVIDVRKSLPSKPVFEHETITVEDQKLAEELGLIDPTLWRVHSFPDRTGLYLLPRILKKKSAATWLARTFEYAKPPSVTNLTIHGLDVVKDPHTLDKGLRWTTLGVEYDWNTKQYPPEGRPVPRELFQLGNLISRSLRLGNMRPDATIVNYYPPKSALSPHVDKSERSNAPLISMSLGQTAVYLSGGNSLADKPIPLWLRNGDFLVMHGEQRLVYHAIPCIGTAVAEKETFDAADADADGSDRFLTNYLNSSRVNVTIRQVNP